MIEGMLDQAMDQMKQSAGQPKPNPEAEKAQAQMQADQAKVQMQGQIEQQKAQIQAQTEAAKMQQEAQLEQMRLQHDAQIEQMKQQHESSMKAQEIAQKEQFDRWKAELDASTKLMVARISANPGIDLMSLETQQPIVERIASELGTNIGNTLQQMQASHDAMASTHAEAMDGVRTALQALMAPKRIVRGPDGRAAGVEIVQQQEIPFNETRQ
jgi:hypothetical protein